MLFSIFVLSLNLYVDAVVRLPERTPLVSKLVTSRIYINVTYGPKELLGFGTKKSRVSVVSC